MATWRWQDVDVVLAEGLERLGGDAGAGLHARAHDADLGDVLVDHVFARVDIGKDALHRLAGALLVGARQVKLMSVMPSSDTFWMIMSTLTWLPAKALNSLAATPDMSGTPRW